MRFKILLILFLTSLRLSSLQAYQPPLETLLSHPLRKRPLLGLALTFKELNSSQYLQFYFQPNGRDFTLFQRRYELVENDERTLGMAYIPSLNSLAVSAERKEPLKEVFYGTLLSVFYNSADTLITALKKYSLPAYFNHEALNQEKRELLTHKSSLLISRTVALDVRMQVRHTLAQNLYTVEDKNFKQYFTWENGEFLLCSDLKFLKIFSDNSSYRRTQKIIYKTKDKALEISFENYRFFRQTSLRLPEILSVKAKENYDFKLTDVRYLVAEPNFKQLYQKYQETLVNRKSPLAFLYE